MRRVERAADLPGAFEVAQREAEAAFSDGGLYVERLLEGARHVEVQVMADGLGGALVCGDRECSIQRRHQKLIEEAPRRTCLTRPARPCTRRRCAPSRSGTTGAPGRWSSSSTLEGQFFFLELNARLQVEHPVTELVTGLDLVAEQLGVAAGGCCRAPASPRPAATPSSAASTPRTRRATSARGPAGAGLRMPGGPGIRVDSHCEAGESIPRTTTASWASCACGRPTVRARSPGCAARSTRRRSPASPPPCRCSGHRARRAVRGGPLHDRLPGRARRALPSLHEERAPV